MGRINQNNLENCFPHIADFLLLSKGIPEDIGLFSGKMGVAIFCYQYSRITGKFEFEAIAERLLDEVFEKISIATSVYFRDGLAGIGWGVEFLLQSGFITADTNDILEEVDLTMFGSLRFMNMKKIGLSDGLLGTGFYLLMRIKNPAANDDTLSTLMIKYYLVFLIDELERRTRDLSSLSKEHFPENNGNELKSFLVISWDFPVLIWFLSELLDQDIFNYKVEKIVSRLILLLNEDCGVPRLHINRLLLLLAIEKLRISFAGLLNSTGQFSESTITERMNLSIIMKEIVPAIRSRIDRFELDDEISDINGFVGNGVVSVAWIYAQLLMLTSDSGFRDDLNFWVSKAGKFFCGNGGLNILEDLPEMNLFVYGSLCDDFIGKD